MSSGMQSKFGSNEPLIVLFIFLLGKLYLWNALPNGRHAYFFDVNSAKRCDRRSFTKGSVRH